MRSKYILWSVVGLVLAASLIANYRLFRLSQSYYLQANGVRLEPLGLSRYPNEALDRADSGGRRVVLVGDSRAEFWTQPELAGFEFVNRGISGQTTAQIRGRFVEHVAPLRPDVVVMQLGVNDLKAIPLFPHLGDEILANCKANIGWLVEESEKLGAEVILTTVFSRGPVSLERRLVWTDEVDAAIRDVNRFMFTMESESVTVLDAERLLAGDDHITDDRFRIDMLHVNEDAYTVLNEELVEILGSIADSP